MTISVFCLVWDTERTQIKLFPTSHDQINSLAPGRFLSNFRQVIFKLNLVIDGCDISCEVVLRWMSMDLTDDRSALVKVMAWCHQATSHYMSQCWPRAVSPYGVARPQWVKRRDALQNSTCWWWLVKKTSCLFIQTCFCNNNCGLKGSCRCFIYGYIKITTNGKEHITRPIILMTIDIYSSKTVDAIPTSCAIWTPRKLRLW